MPHRSPGTRHFDTEAYFEVAAYPSSDSIACLQINHIDARRREFRSHSAGETKGYESPF
jgi:hypothetical protein